MIIIFIELCRIADSLSWIPKSLRRTSSIFCIPDIIAFTNNRIPTIISKFTSISTLITRNFFLICYIITENPDLYRKKIRDSLMVRMGACRVPDRGSIPRRGDFFGYCCGYI